MRAGDSAIVYDPACEFVNSFTMSTGRHRAQSTRRPDAVLEPVEGTSAQAEAKALAVSLYQPEGVTNRFLLVEAPQKIFAHLLTYLPTPVELVQWMSDPRRNRPIASREPSIGC